MKIEVKKEENSICIIEVTIEAARLDEAYDKHLEKAIRSVTVPGFRKGKAPAKVAERHINKSLLMQQVIEELAPQALQEAVDQNNMIPLTEPSMEIIQLEKGKDFIIKASFELRPEIEISDYEGFEIIQERAEIKDEDVDNTIKIMQENTARLNEIEEDRGLKVGDAAIVDFESSSEGKPIDKGNATNYLMELKEDMFIPGFVDNIKDLKKGDEKEFQVKFPDDYPSELKGKLVDFKFKVHTIKEKVMSEINDDFAREVSKFPTLQELKDDIKEKLAKKVNDQAESSVGEKIADLLIKKVDVEMPPSLIAYEQQNLIGDLARNMAAQGISLEEHLRKQNKSIASLIADFKPLAENMGKLELALEAIGRKEKIEIAEEEVDAKIKEIAGELKQDFDKLKATLKKEGRVGSLKYGMLKKKIIDFLIGKSKITYILPEQADKSEEKAEPVAAGNE